MSWIDDLYHLISYYNASDPLICNNYKDTLFIQRALRLYRCDVLKALCIQYNAHDYLGKEVGSLELFKKIIAIYYLASYFKELFSATDDDEIEYVKDLYNFCELEICIKKLGISISELQDLYEIVLELGCCES